MRPVGPYGAWSCNGVVLWWSCSSFSSSHLVDTDTPSETWKLKTIVHDHDHRNIKVVKYQCANTNSI